jgi:hypothetical protein
VVGQRDGVKIGVRPLVFPWKFPDLDKKRMYLCFGMRIRAVGAGVENAAAMFNLPFVQKEKDEQKYASVVVGVPVIALPASPAEIHKVVAEQMVVQALLGDLIAKIGDKTELLSPDLIMQFLSIGYENEVPEIPVKAAPEHKMFIAD